MSEKLKEVSKRMSCDRGKLKDVMLVDEQFERAGMPSLYSEDEARANAKTRQQRLAEFENIQAAELVNLADLDRTVAEARRQLRPE